jgi:hypothetical protein
MSIYLLDVLKDIDFLEENESLDDEMLTIK